MGFNPANKEAIVTALNSVVPCELHFSSGVINAIGICSLPAEYEQSIAQQICKAVWDANQKYCRVSVICGQYNSIPMVAE